ncbi:MAG: aminotransferase class V-fold PLP-dependent enzyme [Actinobacteria bacterium]|uniref:Kynureninase n=1 Tax=Candidatus Fonsibacter lacus TaxID=2576439 RepID=A0A965GCN5_9PROT|nr:aminotransferase class V-fold PLP-dependent enzyme [Candidatus Fonsibacter lacus]
MAVTRADVLRMDSEDRLAPFRSEFFITDSEVCYLDGNSLGRMPRRTIESLHHFLTDEWGTKVVDGWGDWIDEASQTGDLIGRSALGAAAGQVLACDTTSVNLYQLCSAAIKARPGRKKIITDAANFPTDRYILQGLAKEYGLELIMIDNESIGLAEHERITPEILAKYLDDDVALVSLQVIQYRSGARSDIKALTELVRAHGALLVWDASHAIGAIELDFDKNGIDLAVGCTYKYGNSGPGAPAWLYVRKAIQQELQVPIQGWFAQRDQFAMGPDFERSDEIRGFQIASPSIIGLRAINSAFKMIEEAGISAIEAKARTGTALMIELFDQWLARLGFELNTSREPFERGGHISLWHEEAKRISAALRKYQRVIPDYRVPNQLRLAISPLATSYGELFDGFERITNSVRNREYLQINDESRRVT